MNKDRPPSFFENLWISIDRDSDANIIFKYIPFWYLFFCVAIPYLITFHTKINFSFDESKEALIILSSLSITTSGILGAFAIGASIHISSLSSQFPLSDYLIEYDILEEFLFFPQYVISIQMMTLIYATVSILVSFFAPLNIVIFLIFSVGFSMVMMCTKTWELISVMRQLSWYHSHFMAEYNKNQSNEPQDMISR